MISSFQSTLSNQNHSIEDDPENPLSSMDTKINLEETMSISINNIETKNDQQKINKDVGRAAAEEEANDDDDNETSRLVSVKIEDNQEPTSVITLRSILRKRGEKKFSNEGFRHIQHTSITMDEEDSDYTGDENEENDDDGKENDDDDDAEAEEEEEEEEENNGSKKSIEEKSKNNEQEQHQRSYNYSRHQRKNQFLRTSPSTPLDFPLSAQTGTATTTSSSPPCQRTFRPNDQSLTRTTCVTFTKDQPIIIHRSSSTPQLSGLDNQPRTSVTFINMREDLSTTIPITTTAGTSATLTSEFRPVYVSPLKYRPLVGLSANDNRLLLEKRVSLLGRPLVFHPIQKRSPNYRRSQLRVYNFLERPHGCKAGIYHTFV